MLGYRSSVTSETTHLVCGQNNKRTINTLKAMLRGCWILSKDWLLQSLEEGHWQEETDYELVTFSPAVRMLREERQTFRGVFQSDLFKGNHLNTLKYFLFSISKFAFVKILLKGLCHCQNFADGDSIF